jgi:O-succinylbenzoic acid--CoA ligase
VINGRYDHIINTGGMKVSPEAIENKLKKFIKSNFMVTSVPDVKLGEKIILVIESNQSNLNELYNLWKKIDFVLKPYEIPKFIEFFMPFPRTSTGKIARKALQDKICDKLKEE